MHDMLVIKNKVNTISQLASTPKDMGVLADIRAFRDSPVVQQEPFLDGEPLDEYIKHFAHAFIVFSIKSEGIESKVMEMAERAGIDNYFLLGVTPPAAKKLIAREFKKFAIRFSDTESIETCKLWEGKTDWVWADIFRDFSLDDKSVPLLKKSFKICTISPEIIGLRGALERYRGKMNMLKVDAVCTDLPELWK